MESNEHCKAGSCGTATTYDVIRVCSCTCEGCTFAFRDTVAQYVTQNASRLTKALERVKALEDAAK